MMTGTESTPTELGLSAYLTVEEAADQSGYSEQYLRRLARVGRIRGEKRGHFWLIEQQDLKRYCIEAERAGKHDRRYGATYQSRAP